MTSSEFAFLEQLGYRGSLNDKRFAFYLDCANGAEIPGVGGGNGGSVLLYANVAAFPAAGNASHLYIADDTELAYRWDVNTNTYIAVAGSGAADPDIVQIGNINPANGDVIQRVSGAWVNQTMAQLKTALGLGNVDNVADNSKPVSTLQAAAIALRQATSEKNAANGYAGLDATGKVPSSLLPGFTDTISVHANFAAFPGTGSASTIYVDASNSKTYRWAPAPASVYIEISASPGSSDVVAEGTVNLYFTNARVDTRVASLISGGTVQAGDADLSAIAALTPSNDDVVQRKGGVWVNRTIAQLKSDLNVTAANVGLGNVNNTSDTGKPVSTLQQAALDVKLNAVYWNTGTSSWGSYPTGAPAGVHFISTNSAAATAPNHAGLQLGDVWERHPDAV